MRNFYSIIIIINYYTLKRTILWVNCKQKHFEFEILGFYTLSKLIRIFYVNSRVGCKFRRRKFIRHNKWHRTEVKNIFLRTKIPGFQNPGEIRNLIDTAETTGTGIPGIYGMFCARGPRILKPRKIRYLPDNIWCVKEINLFVTC